MQTLKEVQSFLCSGHWKNPSLLDLSGLGLGRGLGILLSRAPQLSEFSSLHLGGNFLGDPGVSLLANSPYLIAVSSLNLEQNNIGSTGAHALAYSSNLQQLQSLRLRGNYLGDLGVTALVKRTPKPRSFWQTFLETVKNFLLASCSHSSTQTRVSFKGNHPYRQVVPIRSVSVKPPLRTLDLSWNNITDKGACELSSAPFLQHLVSLNLQGNQIGEQGAFCLASSPYLNNILSLNLSNNQMTPHGQGVRRLQKRFGSSLRM